VTFKRLLVCDFPGSSNLEALLRTGIRFYFRHYNAFLFYTLLADLHRQITCWALRAIRSWPEMGRKIMDLMGKNQKSSAAEKNCFGGGIRLLIISLVL